jgi:hypothetical protein
MEEEDLEEFVPEEPQRPIYQRTKPYGNTGPKGVLYDYAEAKEDARLAAQHENADAWADVRARSFTVQSHLDEQAELELEVVPLRMRVCVRVRACAYSVVHDDWLWLGLLMRCAERD